MQLEGLIIHANGSYTRESIPTVPANPEFVNGVSSKDETIDDKCNLWARVFRPQSDNTHLPLLLFFHGGGFLQASADTPGYHQLCESLCKKLVAIVVSVNYRIAPEYRLPVAYEDAFTSLKWLQTIAKGETNVPWLSKHADFSRLFIVGDSAAGNIAYHLTKRAAHKDNDWSPMKLAGLVLVQPFFGGVKRTRPELVEFGPNQLTTEVCDIFWKYALPEGADRDHPFSNPLVELPQALNNVKLPKTFVAIGTGDLLHQRQLEFVNVLKEFGSVEQVVYENMGHAFYMADSEETMDVLDKISVFVRRWN